MEQKKQFESLAKDSKITKILRFAASNRLISIHWFSVISLNITATFTIVFSVLANSGYATNANLLSVISTTYSILTLVLGLIIFAYDHARRSWELHRNGVKLDYFNRKINLFIATSSTNDFNQKNFEIFNNDYQVIINESINHEQIDYYLGDQYCEKHPFKSKYYLVKSKIVKILMLILMVSPLIFLLLKSK